MKKIKNWLIAFFSPLDRVNSIAMYTNREISALHEDFEALVRTCEKLYAEQNSRIYNLEMDTADLEYLAFQKSEKKTKPKAKKKK